MQTFGATEASPDNMPPPKLNHLPQHVAIIMDGNGRWAEQRHLPRLAGHRQGANTAFRLIETFAEYGIAYLTLYAFSTENWSRPKAEVEGLFKIMDEKIDEAVAFAQKRGIRLYHIGKPEGLPIKIQNKVKRALEQTRNNTGMTLCIAFNYGGRDEMVEAARRLASSGIQPEQIDEMAVSQHLYTAGIPDPDLIIRTGGEMRLSNFLLWQSAYSEIYFTPALWPDFDKKEIDKALADYSQRQRRFGKLPKK